MENNYLTQLLGELFQLMNQFGDLELRMETSLTPSELHIVECIGFKTNVTSKEIGERLNITKGGISQQIKKLIEQEIIIKEKSKQDKRVSYLILTKKGKKFYKEHQKIKEKFESDLVGNLNELEMKGFLKGIELLNKSLLEKIKGGTNNER